MNNYAVHFQIIVRGNRNLNFPEFSKCKEELFFFFLVGNDGGIFF